MVFVVEPAIVAPLRGRAADRCTFADRVREISHPSGDAGAEAEKITAEATACAAPAVTPEPDAVAAMIVDSNIASAAESWFPALPELHRPLQAVPRVQLCIRLQLRAFGRFSQATAGRLLSDAGPSSCLTAQANSTCCCLRTCCFGKMPRLPLLSKPPRAARIAPTVGGLADFGRRGGLGARRGCRSWSWRHPCDPEVAGSSGCQTPIRAGAWRTNAGACGD